jgi:hypothetical protein
MNFRKLIIAFAAATVLASFASVADAASRHRQNTQGFDAFGSAPFADSAATEVDGARPRALRECNDAVAGMRESTYGVQVSNRYRACMAEHGQPE